MKNKQLILLILAGIISFSSAFGVSWFLKKKKIAAMAQQAKLQEQQQAASVAQDNVNTRSFPVASIDRAATGMSERQLQSLIYDVRNKLKECDERQIALNTEAERIEISRESLQNDIEYFNTLRDKLNTSLVTIREKEESLKNSLTEIETLEKTNFQHLATIYEKMDPVQAGRIIVSMAASNKLQDPVKIIYYMNERTAGDLLAEIANVKPELASLLCIKLEHVKEM